MIFPEKLDVLTVHATLIAETGGTTDYGMKLYSNRPSPLLTIAIAMKLPML
jgi:hypothetical protein